MRRRAEPAAADAPPAIVLAPRLAPAVATRRWAALLQQIFEVDPLACPSCHGAMRLVAFMTQGSGIDQILAHLRTRAARTRSTRGPSGPGAHGKHRPDGHRGAAAGRPLRAGRPSRGRRSLRTVPMTPDKILAAMMT